MTIDHADWLLASESVGHEIVHESKNSKEEVLLMKLSKMLLFTFECVEQGYKVLYTFSCLVHQTDCGWYDKQ